MKKNAILFSASNYTKSPLIQIDDLPGVKYDIQAMHKRLTQIGFEPEAPEIGKELYVTFDIQKYDNSIIITTNLPDNYILLVKSNLSKNSDRKTVTNGSVMLENAQNISSITIGSAFITDSSVKKQLGTKARNLIGEYVKYDPICGNQIHAVFNF